MTPNHHPAPAIDGTGCVLTLTHERLPTAYHEATKDGWGKMFTALDEVLAEGAGKRSGVRNG